MIYIDNDDDDDYDDFCSISLKIRIIIKCGFFSSTSILK